MNLDVMYITRLTHTLYLIGVERWVVVAIMCSLLSCVFYSLRIMFVDSLKSYFKIPKNESSKLERFNVEHCPPARNVVHCKYGSVLFWLFLKLHWA